MPYTTSQTLEGLAREVQRQTEARRDFVTDTRMIRFRDDLTLDMLEPGETSSEALARLDHQAAVTETLLDDILAVTDHFPKTVPMPPAITNNFTINTHTHGQIGARLQIPRPFYQRLQKEHPDLLATNVNYLFTEEPERRLLRTLDGQARAFLSNRYRCMDNIQVMSATLEALSKAGADTNLHVTDITESHLYIKAEFPRIGGEIIPGDRLRAGVIITNSEIGVGSVSIRPWILRLVCSNGMVAADSSGFKRNHLGGTLGDGEIDWSDDTRMASDRLLVSQMQDAVSTFCDQERFTEYLVNMREVAGQKIEKDVQRTVELTQKKFNLTDTEGSAIFRNLVNGADLTRWGLANAVTLTSQDSHGLDRATELEVVGGLLMALDTKEFAALAA